MMSGSWWLWIVLPFVVSGGFILLSFVLAFVEKRNVWHLAPLRDENSAAPVAPHGNLGDAEPPPLVAEPIQAAYQPPPMQPEEELPITDSAMRDGRALSQMGYQFLGSYRHTKGGIYKIRYDALISSDRQILATVESGKLASIGVHNVTMTSLGDAKNEYQAGARSTSQPPSFMVESITNESCYDYDFSASSQTMNFPGAAPLELESLHRRRFGSVDVRAFQDDPLDEFRQYCQRRGEAAENAGKLHFLDAERNAYRPSVLSALTAFFCMYRFMLGRRIYPHRWRVKRLPAVSDV